MSWRDVTRRCPVYHRVGGCRKAVVATLVLLVLFWEVFGHWLWFAGVSVPERPKDSVRLLLVADPQIQGFHHELPLALGYVTRWDVYRYLRSYVVAGFHLVRPDEVVFLGDLLDEGSTASESEFSHDAHTFHRLFPWSVMPRQTFVAGDNDIGGEGNDVITERRTGMFAALFGAVNGEKSMTNGLPLVWVNSLTLSGRTRADSEVSRQTEDFVRSGLHDDGYSTEAAGTRRRRRRRHRRPSVLLLHYPLTSLTPERRRELFDAFNVTLVFSAHKHRLATTAYSRSGRPHYAGRVSPAPAATWSGNSVLTLTRASGLTACDGTAGCVLDVGIPTVSYRMGERSMAVVMADIDATGGLQSLTVLPLPSRYPVLAVYAGLSVVCAAVSLCSRSCLPSLCCHR